MPTMASGVVRKVFETDLHPLDCLEGDLMPLCRVEDGNQESGVHLAAGIIQQEEAWNHNAGCLIQVRLVL